VSNAVASPPPPARRRVPLAVKVAYTAFVCVLVPFYWHTYGPTNFLYFCDIALLMSVPAVWLENSLLVSMPAVGILLPQSLWMIDFLGAAVGLPLTGMTGYMFDPGIPLLARGLSFFHFWLPLLLVWLVWRLGYDRRALPAWTLLAWVLLLLSYFLLPPPPPPADNPNLPVNVNNVYGMSPDQPQTWMPPLVYLALLLVGMPLVLYLPVHLVLRKVCPQAPRSPCI